MPAIDSRASSVAAPGHLVSSPLPPAEGCGHATEPPKTGGLDDTLDENLCNSMSGYSRGQCLGRNSNVYGSLTAHALSQDERGCRAPEREPEHIEGLGAAVRLPETAAVAR